MTYPKGTGTRRKFPSNSCLQGSLEFLPLGRVPKPNCLVLDLEPVLAHPRLRFAASYLHAAFQPLATTTAPDPLLSLTVAPP